MFRFKIHFELPDGSEDSLVLEDDDIEELRTRASAELERRGAKNPWSEELA